jgi:CheY-like chemotaxis protein
MKQEKNKILMADDDPAILEVLTFFWEEVGYEVETCTGYVRHVYCFPSS